MKLNIFGICELDYSECRAAFNAITLVDVSKSHGIRLRPSQVADKAVENLSLLSPETRERFLMIGAIAAANHYLEAHNARRRAHPRNAEELAKKKEWHERAARSIKAAHAARSEKVKAFDRIVEMLDHHIVNGKPLGDCRRSDLLRAAMENVSKAEDLTVQATLYRQLASMIGDGTVREYRDRAGVVALLTTTFEPTK